MWYYVTSYFCITTYVLLSNRRDTNLYYFIELFDRLDNRSIFLTNLVCNCHEIDDNTTIFLMIDNYLFLPNISNTLVLKERVNMATIQYQQQSNLILSLKNKIVVHWAGH